LNSTTTIVPQNKLPWWTWLAPFVLFHLASQIALLFKYDQGVSTFYIPTAIAVVLINWWGLARVIPAMYIITTLNTYYWGVEEWWLWPAFSASEVIAVTLSFYLFRKLVKGQYWLPTTRHLILFIVFALLIPLVIELILLQYTLTYFGQQPITNFGEFFLRNWLGEFMANFGITIPLLYSITPVMQRNGWLLEPPDQLLSRPSAASTIKRAEIGIIYCSLVALSLLIPFERYWFAYGIISLYVAIRFGFGEAAFCNLFIFMITYVLPSYFSKSPALLFNGDDPLYSIFLGNLLLSLFVAITGRVITDLQIAEKKLHLQNQELENTNKELDRFVYSTSHDLSAPLKSILGLVTISKMDSSPQSSPVYLNQIEKSVLQLDSFINEILDYSRNKRMGISAEQVELKELCQEILNNLKYMDDFANIEVDLKELEESTIQQDKVRLKIILSNLISNAIRFQKRIPGHKSIIKISSSRHSNNTLIHVEDNGEGIRPELNPKIFEMFFRASDKSKGSGLGLYIAKESAEKIGAKISLKSEYGKGSTFTIEIPEI
jgi:two-component system, sensor histidine kinase